MSQKKAKRNRERLRRPLYSEQQWTAYHEAAHAVADLGNGIPFHAIHLADDSGRIVKSDGAVLIGSVGLVDTNPNDWIDQFIGKDEIVGVIVSFLAGICADKIINPSQSYRTFIVEKGSIGDWVTAVQVYFRDQLTRHGIKLSQVEIETTLFENFLPLAQNYVRSHWRAIKALGDALLAAPNRTLTYDECRAVLGLDVKAVAA
jgi:hypothetical protein